jgi:hypothetical protein
LTHFSPNKILESFEILRLTRFERRKFDSRKMIPKKAQDDNFVRQDFCGKKKKSLLQRRNSERRFSGEHEEIGPRNTRPKKYQNKES